MSKLLQIIIIILISFPTFALAEEAVVGEIININYQYEIAFTDLSDYHLQDGDIVEVRENNQFLTYLEVSSASEAISKLVPVQNEAEYKTNIPFSKVQVGSTIVKAKDKAFKVQGTYNASMGVSLPNTTNPSNNASTLKAPVQSTYQGSAPSNNFQELSQNYMILSNNLARALNEKTTAEQESMQTKQELEIAINRIQELEAQTTLLKDELSALRSKGAFKKSQQKIKALEEKIKILKKKFEKMALLLEGK
jgi:hypothetical protein